MCDEERQVPDGVVSRHFPDIRQDGVGGGGGARSGAPCSDGGVGLVYRDGVSAFAVVARGPFEADIWVGGEVVVCFCGV